MKLRNNEKSEAIELIKESEYIFNKYDLIFKKAGGESSLQKDSEDVDLRAKTLFPDVLFYEDEYQTKISVGWELKMPDTDINNVELYENARDKAERMGLKLFVLWNFQSVYIYTKTNEKWSISYNNTIANITTRDDVKYYRKNWKTLLEEVILKLNELIIRNEYSATTILSNSKSIAEYIAKEHSEELADYYQKNLTRKELVEIEKWHKNELAEFMIENKNINISEKLNIYSKFVLLKWINRLVFCNLISKYQNTVYNAVKEFNNEDLDLHEVALLFNEATKVSDHYSIISVGNLEKKISPDARAVLREYNGHLMKSNLEKIDHLEFQQILESIINVSKREYMGLYTTPEPLAKILVKSTLNEQHSNILDPCVGSGTITKAVLNELTPNIGVSKAHDQVWASDKYSLPLQVANLSMSTKESINYKNIIFQRDLLSLKEGDEIEITNPQTGKPEKLKLPKFDYIFANFPFISSNKLSKEEKKKLIEVNEYLASLNLPPLDMKRDWYEFALIGINRILNEEGKAAIITSNSWLKTKKVKNNQFNLINNLLQIYNVEKIIVSNNTRWFQNANIATTMIVLNKSNIKQNTHFIKLNSDILNIEEEELDIIANDLLLDNIESEHYFVESYSPDQIKYYINKGFSLNILFNNLKWFMDIESKLVPMSEIFSAQRGAKSNNDSFFCNKIDKPNKDFNSIEKEYIKPELHSPNKIDSFFAKADGEIFVTELDTEGLKKIKHYGALEYIQKNELRKKTKSQLELKQWYSYPKVITGDFVTAVNPDKRLFWSRVDENVAINQRLTVFKLKDLTVDKELIHALLNSYISQFMIEATGFGRGLGVLDTTADGIIASLTLDYRLLTDIQITAIINQWHGLSSNIVPTVEEQLVSLEWNEFNKVVFEAFGIEDKLPCVKKTLLDAIKLRKVK